MNENMLDALVKGEIPECNMKNLETTIQNCHRDGYWEEYCHDGYYLMLLVDDCPGENEKNFWDIVSPDGTRQSAPEHLFKRGFTYSKPTMGQFQFMVIHIKLELGK